MRKLALVAMLGAVASMASAAVIFDQIGGDPSYTVGAGKNVFASQEFEAAYSAYSIGVVDNFTVSGGIGSITRADAVLGFWNGTATYANITGYRVEFYSSTAMAAANLVGDQGHIVVAPGSVTVTNPWGAGANGQVLVSIPVSGITLGNGTHYMAVIPQMAFSGIGQCGVSGSTLGDLNLGQANPGGGFGFAGNYSVYSPADNAAYRLQAVPEPAALALLALAGLIRRR